MTQTNATPRRNDYRIRGDRRWALIRPRYLKGESAPRLAEVFGVTEYAIRKRIWREGWSKRSLAEAEEAGLPEPDEGMAESAVAAGDLDETMLDPRAAARLALDEAVRLMRSGQMTGAAEAARVADVLARAAARLEGDAAADPGEPDEAAFEAVRRKVLGWDEPAGPPPAGEGNREAVEGVFGDSDVGERPPPPPFGRSRRPAISDGRSSTPGGGGFE